MPSPHNGTVSPWRWALAEATSQMILEDETGQHVRVLDLIAKKVARAALIGESWAIQEIGNRLDGRPAQAVTLSLAETPRLEGPARLAELARRIAYLRALAAEPEAGAGLEAGPAVALLEP